MEPKNIFIPILAQVLLMFLVWIWLYVGRLGSIYRNKIKIQTLSDPKIEETVFKPALHASDNFENQFEMPVLFFVASIVIYLTESVDTLYLCLTSLFVFVPRCLLEFTVLKRNEYQRE